MERAVRRSMLNKTINSNYSNEEELKEDCGIGQEFDFLAQQMIRGIERKTMYISKIE